MCREVYQQMVVIFVVTSRICVIEYLLIRRCHYRFGGGCVMEIVVLNETEAF